MGLYISHPSSHLHDTGSHPENASRLVAIEAALEATGWAGLERVEAPAATREQLLRVHAGEHIDAIEEFCARGGGMIDVDTVAGPDSYVAALHAAGGACRGAEAVLAQESAFAFCGLRPPGHHAERGQAMGFCLFNNVAVAAAHVLAGGAERVLVLDWDVHHGNGTEAIFANSPEVLYVSVHQRPLYPGTGDADYTGVGDGQGYTRNLPVPPGAGSDEFLALVEHVVVPLGREFAPDLVAISAGYDAHRDDPLASCLVDTETYGDMAAAMRELAAELDTGLLICLEGGYSPRALAASVVETITALNDGRSPRQTPPAAAEPHLARLRDQALLDL